MNDTLAAGPDAEQLLQALAAPKLHPAEIEALSRRYDDSTRTQAITQVAAMFDPPPAAGLLARLVFLRSPANEALLAQLFIANLRAAQADARLASLRGLEALRHPSLTQFALLSLRDESDPVVAAACQILLPQADPRVRQFLRQAWLARKGRPEFYLSNSVLEAAGIGAAVAR